MTTDKKRQCYPLCFFSWRPKKNNSVTPHVSFGENDSVTPCFIRYISTVLPLMGFSWRQIKNDSVTLYVSFDKNDSVTPYVFLPWRLMKIFYLTKTILFFFQICFFSWWPIKYDSVTPYILFDKDNSVTPYSFFRDDQ